MAMVMVLLISIGCETKTNDTKITDVAPMKKAEREKNFTLRLIMGDIIHERKELLNPETANLSDLKRFKNDRQQLESISISDEERKKITMELKEDGLSWSDLELTEMQLKEIELNCHKNETNWLYSLLEHKFDLDTYNSIRNEAKQAGIRIADLFSTGKVRINAIQREQQLLYNTGWRKATTEENAKFQDIENRERQKIEEAYKQCLKDKPPKFYLVSGDQKIEIKSWFINDPNDLIAQFPKDFDGSADLLIDNPCDQSNAWFPAGVTSLGMSIPRAIVYYDGVHSAPIPTEWDVLRGWMKTDDGYKVPTFIDVEPILAADGLMVVDNYIHPQKR